MILTLVITSMHAIGAIKNDEFYDILILIKEIPRTYN